MTPKHDTSNDRLALLRFARREAAAANKRSNLLGFSKSLRQIEKQAKRIRKHAAAGKIKRAFARRVLSRFDSSRRKIGRLMNATAALRKRTLLMLDREIRRARPRAR
jgi:hypothetical protein